MNKPKKATPASHEVPGSGRTRPRFAQDFSMEKHGRKTDSSFAAACDVNAIVKHYSKTGVDQYADRIPQARYEEASTQTYDEAMRIVAELDSAFNEQPDSVRSQHPNSAAWLEYLGTVGEAPPEASEASETPPAEPAPQDSSDDNSEEKVQ